jgi:hypothetical protein
MLQKPLVPCFSSFLPHSRSLFAPTLTVATEQTLLCWSPPDHATQRCSALVVEQLGHLLCPLAERAVRQPQPEHPQLDRRHGRESPQRLLLPHQLEPGRRAHKLAPLVRFAALLSLLLLLLLGGIAECVCALVCVCAFLLLRCLLFRTLALLTILLQCCRRRAVLPGLDVCHLRESVSAPCGDGEHPGRGPHCQRPLGRPLRLSAPGAAHVGGCVSVGGCPSFISLGNAGSV